MKNRIQFNQKGDTFFANLFANSRRNISYFATDAGVSERTIRSWRSGQTSMPLTKAEDWSRRFGVMVPKHSSFDLRERRKVAGTVGGRARQLLYGDLGTPEGRSRGGVHSMKTHRMKEHSPFVSRKVLSPQKDVYLAELVGAILGDGGLTEYQLILSVNGIDDTEYAEFLRLLIIRIFNIEPRIIHYPKNGVIKIICSRKNLVKYLQSIGLVIGNKVKHQVGVPPWIQGNPSFARACIRGLIDTDGCVYIDRHHINGKTYESYGIAFTNASLPLLNFVEQKLTEFGYSPTSSGRHIRLRRRPEVFRYAKEIGFSNPKHSRKIKVE